MKQWIRQWLPAGTAAVILVMLSAFLLRGDVWTFWTWWLLALLLGMAAMPVTGRLFCHFEDKGWLFSKVLAIVAGGFVTWFLVAVKILPFTAVSCVGVSVAGIAGCLVLFRRQQKRNIESFPVDAVKLVCWEEILFFGIFLMWTYLAGFRPQAYGTEKFMDYGFMEAMMRSTVLPARDLWYSEGHINYYYGGQYFAVFLTKLTGSRVELTYNLMRSFVAGFAFVLPFSLVYQMTKDRIAAGALNSKKCVLVLSGLTAGTAVSIAGNMHYVIYAKIIPAVQKFSGAAEETGSYWFPDATRYIGHNPDVPDKTIHEFPCYSFVLGDLHAHVVNIMFVLFLVGLLYAWMYMVRKETEEKIEEKTGRDFWLRELLMPHVLLAGALLGMFQWTNYWDFVIYFVVTGGVVLFANIIRFDGKIKKIFMVTAAQAAEVIIISTIVIMPFTLQFETMVQGVALAQNHSRFYQLLVLWGLPGGLTVLFLINVLGEKLRGSSKGVHQLMGSMAEPDLFGVILGLCALGLVLIPELVYVRDIYENGNARANTMFKLTYQAYILFGIVMGYGIYRLLIVSRQKIFKICAGTGLFCLLLTVGYFGNSVTSWFGQVWKPAQYKGLDAVTFLETDFPEDAAGVRWLKANIEGAPVVLEANGDSYSGFERVSATTGLPTILGWYVHQWLWRNDVEDLNRKSADIESIYTGTDENVVRELLADYDVSYVFVGSKEREKYGEKLNNSLLQELGQIVFEDSYYDTYIVEVK